MNIKKTFENSVENDLLSSKFGDLFLDKYQLLNKIHEGSVTQIFVIKENETNELFILKAIDKNNEYVWDADAIKTINHPKIVKVIGVGETERYIYLIKEYINGITLEEYINKKGPLAEKDAIAIGIELCEILLYFHSLKPTPMIYRDLKPANLLISEDGIIKLIDLDSIRQYKQNSPKDTYYIGTEGFASPEQFGFSQTDMRTDIYTLGTTLFFLLTGQKPVNDKFKIKNVKSVKNDVSEMFNNIIEKCTMFNPEVRYQSVRELKKQLIYLSRNDSISKIMRLHSRISKKRNFRKIYALVITIIVSIIVYKGILMTSNKGFAYGEANNKANVKTNNSVINSNVFSYEKTTINEAFWSGTLPNKQSSDFVTFYKQGEFYKFNPKTFLISIAEWDDSKDYPQMQERIDKVGGKLILKSKGYKDVPFVMLGTSINVGNKARVYIARLYNDGDVVSGVKYKIYDNSGHWLVNRDVFVTKPNIKEKASNNINNKKFSYDKTTINEAFWSGTIPQKLPANFINYYKQGNSYLYDPNLFFISILEWDNTEDYPQMRERIREVGGKLVLKAKGYKDVPFDITEHSITVPASGQVYFAQISSDNNMIPGVKYKIYDNTGHWIVDKDVVVVKPIKN